MKFMCRPIMTILVQIGIETNINGAQLSVQKLDVYAKQGRII